MSKLKTKSIDFNRETGEARYVYTYKDYEFVGGAQCHEDDMDMCSELVGLKYAEIRAYLQFLKVRKKELRIKAEAFKGLLTNMMHSSDFSFESKYCKKIRMAIRETEEEIEEIREAIWNIPPYLKNDIAARDDLYNKLREKRK